MRFWLPLMFEPPEQWVEIARIAEQCGYEGLALADHVVIPEGFASVHPSGGDPFVFSREVLDTFTAIAAMATGTERLRFMSFVYVVPMRDPFSVAKQVGTAAILSGYRVVLGAGAGWLAEEFAVFGKDMTTRGRRFDESLEIIRDFWDDGYAEHHGAFYDFPRSSMHPAPAEPVPIWIGGKSDAALRRAVRQDGWLGMNYAVPEAQELLARLQELRGEARDERDGFEAFVIPNADPSPELYRVLSRSGATSTMALPWAPGDPSFRPLDKKRIALEHFAERYVDPLR